MHAKLLLRLWLSVLEDAEGSIQHIDKCKVEIAERIALSYI